MDPALPVVIAFSPDAALPYVASGVVVVGVAGYAISSAMRTACEESQAARRGFFGRRRTRRGQAALLDAAAADAAFDPDATVSLVRALIAAVDRRALGRPANPPPDCGFPVVERWFARANSTGGLSHVVGAPRIGVLDVVNRGRDEEDRVALRVTLHLGPAAVHSRLDPAVYGFDTRWTLARGGGHWQVVEIEPFEGTRGTMARPFIARPSDDVERIREESMVELAQADVPAAEHASELVDPHEPAYEALLELSVLDGRFAPALLEASLAHLLDAWETATVASDAPLRESADAAAIDDLLHETRDGIKRDVVARDLTLSGWAATELDAAAQPRPCRSESRSTAPGSSPAPTAPPSPASP